jgi:hypothetical protein
MLMAAQTHIMAFRVVIQGGLTRGTNLPKKHTDPYNLRFTIYIVVTTEGTTVTDEYGEMCKELVTIQLKFGKYEQLQW